MHKTQGVRPITDADFYQDPVTNDAIVAEEESGYGFNLMPGQSDYFGDTVRDRIRYMSVIEIIS